jgi:hypothetical protein
MSDAQSSPPYTPIESNEYDEYMDSDTKFKFGEIIKKDPVYLQTLHNIVTKDPEYLNMHDLFRQLIETEYQMKIKGKGENEARRIAQDAEIERIKLLKEPILTQLREILEKYFTDHVLKKGCYNSNPIMFKSEKTKQDCCKTVCEKINELFKDLQNFLLTNKIGVLGEVTLKQIAPSLGIFSVEIKDSNIFSYIEDCHNEGKISPEQYNTVKAKIVMLSNFFNFLPQQGGRTNSRRKRRTSKKSRKSRRHRRHRRSSHNKKRHTKRHTKRYRKRK